jgi:hypothetical protein
MKIKTNLRAGKGGASGAGQNGGTSTDSTSSSRRDRIESCIWTRSLRPPAHAEAPRPDSLNHTAAERSRRPMAGKPATIP